MIGAPLAELALHDFASLVGAEAQERTIAGGVLAARFALFSQLPLVVGDPVGQQAQRRIRAEELDAAIIFAPVGELVPAALRATAKGGVVVCAGIHMSAIPSFPYDLLWGERVVRSVANLTRRDGEEFLALAPRVPVRTEVETYPLEQANEALDRLRAGRVRGAAVLAVAAAS